MVAKSSFFGSSLVWKS